MDLCGDAQKPKKKDEWVKNLSIGDWGVLLGFSLLLPLHHQSNYIKKKKRKKDFK